MKPVIAPDWKEEHVHRHLANIRSILQADGDKGDAKLYVPDPGAPRLREAVCWAHLRRDCQDEWDKTKSAIAREALDPIGALHDIEREITGIPPRAALSCAGSTAPRRSKPDSAGQNSSSRGSPARAIWPRPSVMG